MKYMYYATARKVNNQKNFKNLTKGQLFVFAPFIGINISLNVQIRLEIFHVIIYNQRNMSYRNFGIFFNI